MKENVFISSDYSTNSLELAQKILKRLKSEENHLKRIDDFINPSIYLQGTLCFDSIIGLKPDDWLRTDLTYNSFFNDFTVHEHFGSSIHIEVFENHSHLQQQANNALSKFRKTGNKEYLFRYKKLLGEIRSLLLDTLLKVKKIARSFKVNYVIGPHIDFRRIYRQRIKMLSRNTDDEAHVVNFFNLNLSLFLNKKIKENQHENPTYTSLHHRSRGHCPRWGQPVQRAESTFTSHYPTVA